jgi:alpha-L-rhamnosidase
LEGGRLRKRLLIRPAPPAPDSNPDHKPIEWVRAEYDSIHGKIVTHWKRAADRFELRLTVPVNTSATVFLPAKDQAAIREGGKPLEEAEGVKFTRMAGDRAVLAVAAGTYEFASSLK